MSKILRVPGSETNVVFFANKRTLPTKKKPQSKWKRNKMRSPKKTEPKKPRGDQPKNKPISIEICMLLFFIQQLKNNKIYDPAELEKFLLDFEVSNHKSVNGKMSKSKVRQIWMYQLRNHQLFCAICGNSIFLTNNSGGFHLTEDHRVPKSKGGTSCISNLEPTHGKCNSLKQDMLPEEWEEVGAKILHGAGIIVNTKNAAYEYIQINKGRRR